MTTRPLLFAALLVLAFAALPPAQSAHLPSRVAYGVGTIGPTEFDALLLWTPSDTGGGHFRLNLRSPGALVEHRIVFAGQELITVEGDGCMRDVTYVGESILAPEVYFRVTGAGPVDVCSGSPFPIEGHYFAWHLRLAWANFDPA